MAPYTKPIMPQHAQKAMAATDATAGWQTAAKPTRTHG
jgi:hypothetical protein